MESLVLLEIIYIFWLKKQNFFVNDGPHIFSTRCNCRKLLHFIYEAIPTVFHSGKYI